MPSGPKKRRAAKRKKKEELDKISASSVVTISKDAIDDSNSSKDANLGDHPVFVATSTAVDSPEPEDKSVNGHIKAISDELNVLPSVDSNATSSIVSDLNEKKCLARTENISFEGIPDYLQVVNDDNPIIYQAAVEGEICWKEFQGDLIISNQDSASANVFSKNSSENVVHDVDGPVDTLHKSVQKGNEDNYLETKNDDAPLSSPPTVISESDKGSPEVQEKGDATLTDHMPSESREGLLLQNDGALQAYQIPLAGILSHKEIAAEDKNVGHDRKTFAVAEQDDSLKNIIEEILDATNKLRELLIKLLHGLDTVQPMGVA